jgi:predicted permease
VLFPAALLVMVTVALVLLVASSNIANLVLARAAERRREIAIRLAVGASRGRIVRQLVSESTILAFLGGLGGVVVAFALASLLVSFRPPLPVPISLDVGVDLRVVLFATGLTTAAVLLFGLVPALQVSRGDLVTPLKTEGSALTRRSGLFRLRGVFLVPQIALSLVLLVVAGLFVRSVANAAAMDPGFRVDRTALIALDLGLSGYSDSAAGSFYATLERRLGASGDSVSVTVTSRIPLDLYGNQSTTVSVARTAGGADEEAPLQFGEVDARYFDVLGIPLLRGRTFDDADLSSDARVAIVSAHAARAFWPNEDPIGRALLVGDERRRVEVVGVVGDVKVQSLGEPPQRFIYLPASGREARLLRVIARGPTEASALVERLRREVTTLDPQVAVFESRTMADHLDVMLFPYRIAASVGGVLGAFGLLLAALGLHGVVSFGVAQRRKELGIRMALGARAADVVRLVLGDHLRVVIIGAVVGLALSLALARVMQAALLGIGPSDPITFVAVVAVLGGVALGASYAPARRATRVEPAVTLRQE